MNPGPTFDRVYLSLKEQLTSGRFVPGEHLEPVALGEELNASITPVRDALHRLVGERLVEAPRGDGFRIPAPTEAELRGLYAWNGELVALSFRSRVRLAPGMRLRAAEQDGVPALDTAAALFLWLAHRRGNPEHEAAIGNLNERLGAARAAETRVFDDVPDELAALRDALHTGDYARLGRAVGAYHRRRQRHAPEILIALRSPAAR